MMLPCTAITSEIKACSFITSRAYHKQAFVLQHVPLSEALQVTASDTPLEVTCR